MSVLTSAPDRDLHVLEEKQPHSLGKPHDAHIETISQRRPSFHLTAPHGWLNDPCGLGYDPATGVYHLSFQWNPYGNDWGHISWGHATSSDLVLWKISSHPVLTPSAEYDRCGVFTGCLRATDIYGQPKALTMVYTSVRRLPIHYTLPYVRGCESLSLAVSHDNGETWLRQDCNPILTGPPENIQVTGWRDPCLTAWSGSQQQQNDSPILYGFISGGITGKTPTIFVYAVQPTDLRKWKYLGPLIDVGLNFSPSRWSGDFGVNWEVGNLMTLADIAGVSRDFVIMGTEGCLSSSLHKDPNSAWHRRVARAQLWMSVKPKECKNITDDTLTTYAFSGIFDHGCYYAANSFWDVQASRQIVFGWITEEDLPDTLRHRQGWSGLITLPRVVELRTIHHVIKARSSKLDSITSIEVVPSSSRSDTVIIRTLGIRPDPRLGRLREGARKSQLRSISLPILSDGISTNMPLTTSRWELDAEFSVSQMCERVGIEIAHSSDFKHCTTLSWNPQDETFTIRRPQPASDNINHGFESAPHTLFTYLNEQGEEQEESLRVHAFFDRSVLEVFLNGRTAISTRIYHPADRCYRLRFFANSIHDDPQPAAVLVRGESWDGLGV
ncbi:hypothetical protein N7474_002617 [Penicillium riverlandense]|uniref:uncharacterized protein n=1 Tax=Penicillium riverlandense TaxID=1903569 RepID=UPI00254734E9|nr:uncharacterized protein N7474_002617 [Penicillium riverlandense]KAJ5825479.1 hypothetical protein N7474_002617 [Penicillium riverlandense]